MYYPFFRARQFELLALRELIIEGALGSIIPILEPVKDSFNNLNLAFSVFKKYQVPTYIVLNPIVGDVRGDHEVIVRYLQSVDKTCSLVMPAFHFANNPEYILNTINAFGLSNCMLICPNDIDASSQSFVDLVNLPAISAFTIEDPARNRSLNRLIRDTGETYIRLDDQFEAESRNSNYLNIQERMFTEEHLYYGDEGFNGFCDYTILPKEFADGGSAPRAVVIHLTFLKRDNKIWIRHFTSENNDSIANVQGKFAEAAAKAASFCRSSGFRNSAVQELEEYLDEQHYPGLGTVKKISIKNHLLVVSEFLQSRSAS